MKQLKKSLFPVILILCLAAPLLTAGQGTLADYERAQGLREKYYGLALNMPERPAWIEKTGRFWYRKTVPGGGEFYLVDATTLEKKPAFDHAKLAEALSETLGEKVEALKLRFMGLEFVDEGKAIQFDMKESRYKCDLETYALEKIGPARRFWGGGFDMWKRGPAPEAASKEAKSSPDEAWEAFIKNYNLYIRDLKTKQEFALSSDGSEGNYYTYRSIAWSPDSKKLAAVRLRRGYHRVIQYVESSPADQLQPKYHEMEYAKPGDALDIPAPVLFLVEGKKQINIDNRLFANPFGLSDPEWRKDGRAFTFEYNQRGHQVFRIIEVDGATGAARAPVSEEAETFFDYSGKRFRFDVEDGKEIIWMSERDGWNHLYLIDGAAGTVKNRITKGEWVVRGVEKVDEENRLIYFTASGKNADMDPYFTHFYRIGFDGKGLTALTQGNFDHSVALSTDMAYYLDTRSRVDSPPVMELRRTSDGEALMEVEKTDISGLEAEGWKPPEVFVAKARDGRTDIWGIICRPANFDPGKKYPVVEYIYAGPQGSFVPKSFSPCPRMQPLAELGFIVVQMDGMGTSNRSKAFHDVCWKNLGDAGFPDRILWHKAVAAKYPSYDIERVGIYGGSAGGQNSLGGMLFFPEFYKACVSGCGCHDNRMDKIWWNELWMGWPLGPHYAASSNVENAHRLQGKLLLIVGELDTNVDPASTMQVVNALIKAGKTFDLLVVPGAGHGMGGAYGERRLSDFFVRHLIGVEPPDWNRMEEKTR